MQRGEPWCAKNADEAGGRNVVDDGIAIEGKLDEDGQRSLLGRINRLLGRAHFPSLVASGRSSLFLGVRDDGQ